MLRVSPAGEGFVLYQMPKREVTAVAAGSRRSDLRGRRGDSTANACACNAAAGSDGSRAAASLGGGWRQSGWGCGSNLRRRPRWCRWEWRAAARCTASIPTACRGACGEICRTWCTRSRSTARVARCWARGTRATSTGSNLPPCTRRCWRCRRRRSRRSRRGATGGCTRPRGIRARCTRLVRSWSTKVRLKATCSIPACIRCGGGSASKAT